MSFDPVTFSEIKKLATPIGSAIQVSSEVNDSKYITSGQVFDPVTYPLLASKITPQFNADKFDRVSHAIPSSIFSANASYFGKNMNIGTVLYSFVYSDDFYIITINGYIFKCDESLAFEFVALLPNASYLTIDTIAFTNNRLYFGSDGITYFVEATNLSATPTQTTMDFPAKVKYHDGLYLAIRPFPAGNVAFASTDGISFVSRPVTFTGAVSPTNINYGNGLWVIVSSSKTAGNISTSPDGITWTARTGQAQTSKFLEYNEALSLWICTSSNNVSLQTSPDGITWTSRPQGGTSGYITSLDITDNGVVVAGAGTVSNVNSTQFSTDGITYVNKATVAPFNYVSGNAIARDHNVRAFKNKIIWFGIPSSQGQYHYSVSNDNGTTWSPAAPVFFTTTTEFGAPKFLSDNLTGISLENASRDLPATTELYYRLTKDGGLTWETQKIVFPNTIKPGKVLAVNDTFVFCFNNLLNVDNIGVARFASSTDGKNWSFSPLTALNLVPSYTTSAGNTIFSFLAAGGTFYTSTDFGATWNIGYANTPTTLLTIGENVILIYGGVGAAPVISFTISANAFNSVLPIARTFTPIFSSPSIIWAGGHRASGGTVGAIAENNTTNIYVTFDSGLSWSKKTSPVSITTNHGLNIINGWIMLMTGAGKMYRSKDGVNWSSPIDVPDQDAVGGSWTSGDSVSDGSFGFISGPASVKNGYALRSSSSHYSIPEIPTVPGLKWVIKAKN